MKDNRCEVQERLGKSYRRCTREKHPQDEDHVLGNWSLEALFESVRAPSSKAEDLKARDATAALLQEKDDLVRLAQAAARDERHWSVVDAADRCENAADLARAVLSFFGVQESDCPKKCKDCEDHNRNTDNEDRDRDDEG